ncbi:MAG: type I restriction-modification enzyme R subunit C-terminal domain-containing protein [Pseudomonadota bacterium]|nr:type I restriction-modification enzyme R subunit C-terminal domain-containing protein [Pseudomonadota bacterium]
MPLTPPDLHPEQLARQQIDAKLTAAGWAVQDRAELNLAAAPGVAVREFQTSGGPADYLLFLRNQLVGVLEAKRAGVTLSSIEAQTRDYAARAPRPLQVPVRPLPFLYESTGVETWFTNGLDPIARARPVFSFHRPETLQTWLDAEVHRRQGRPDAPPAATLQGRMGLAPALNTTGMWPAQIRAVENLEASVREGKPRALIQMATGSGKTFTAISAVYRLIREGGARRVLFVVDRGNLGRQALKEFQSYSTPDDGRKFSELYNVVNLTHNVIDPVNKVVITTIQRLYSILRGDETFDDDLEEGSAFDGHGAALVREPPPVVYNDRLPPEFFDVVVVDECHRSIYSLWRQVLEYFDASLIGLTATPAKHTYAFFRQNVVSEYRHEHAVRDKVNVPYNVYEIRTAITDGGVMLVAEPDTIVGRRDRQTREVRWERLDTDETYAASQLDRSVVVLDQIRTVLKTFRAKLFTEIFPGRSEIPKTLIFAKNDDHAEDILRELRELWGLSNTQAVKITYKPERALGDAKRKSASHRPEEVIQAFRNSYEPRIAVTVDMIATGTDIKPLECVVFMRTVKSRALFEQMKGRGVRVMPDADFQGVTRDAQVKTHFVVVDCVGVTESDKVDPPIDRERTLSFDQLLELVRAGNRSEDVISTLAARLDRIDRRLSDADKETIERASGGASLREIVQGLLDAIDPDREAERARAIFSLPEGVEPTEEQIHSAQALLREEGVAVLAYNPTLCEVIQTVRKRQEVTLDDGSVDTATAARWRPDLTIDHDAAKELVSAFKAYCADHREELEALQVLYERPYAQRLTRKQLVELAGDIKRPPRQWTSESLWAAYERVESGRVRGASKGKVMTDLISLVRHALGVDAELVSYAEQAQERFDGWLQQQANRGRRFTPEQMGWLELIRDRIVVDLEVQKDDLDDMPFAERGGLGKAWSLFGDELEGIVDELNVAVGA